jgi:hypothetical protein
MNLRNRIKAVERMAMEAGYGTKCLKCHGPIPGYDTLIVLDAAHKDVTPRCPVCGNGLALAGPEPRRGTASAMPVNAKAYAGFDPAVV